MGRMVLSLLLAAPLALGCSSDDGGMAGSGGSAGSGGAGGAAGSGGDAGGGGEGGAGGAGGAAAECDPLLQDCDAGEGCYLILQTGVQSCETPFEPGTQDEPCQFANNCAVGYGCVSLEDGNSDVRTCAFFCDPEGGSPSCADGPGPAYDCRRINGEFWADVPNVSTHLGMCVDPLVFPAP
jgi:hypothetical protein